jgi:hypothetical protein
VRPGLAAAAVSILLAGCDDLTLGTSIGGTPLTPEPATGGVAGMAWVIQRVGPEGNTHTAVSLRLADAADAARILEVASPVVTAGETEYDLLTRSPNVFYTNDERSGIAYEAGQRYTFAVDVAVSGKGTVRFEAAVVAPAAPPTVDAPAAQLVVAGETPLDLSVARRDDAGLVIVSTLSGWYTSAGVTHDSWAAVVGDKTGLAAMRAMRDAALDASTPTLSIPASAFAVPGGYWAEVYSVAVARDGDSGVSDDWAAGSWFAAGAPATLAVDAN